jgi:hypothetical protein
MSASAVRQRAAIRVKNTRLLLQKQTIRPGFPSGEKLSSMSASQTAF